MKKYFFTSMVVVVLCFLFAPCAQAFEAAGRSGGQSAPANSIGASMSDARVPSSDLYVSLDQLREEQRAREKVEKKQAATDKKVGTISKDIKVLQKADTELKQRVDGYGQALEDRKQEIAALKDRISTLETDLPSKIDSIVTTKINEAKDAIEDSAVDKAVKKATTWAAYWYNPVVSQVNGLSDTISLGKWLIGLMSAAILISLGLVCWLIFGTIQRRGTSTTMRCVPCDRTFKRIEDFIEHDQNCPHKAAQPKPADVAELKVAATR